MVHLCSSFAFCACCKFRYSEPQAPGSARLDACSEGNGLKAPGRLSAQDHVILLASNRGSQFVPLS